MTNVQSHFEIDPSKLHYQPEVLDLFLHNEVNIFNIPLQFIAETLSLLYKTKLFEFP
jgi:hypothetical protein